MITTEAPYARQERLQRPPIQLLCAENVPYGEHTMPQGSQATWGTLERALAARSEADLDKALTLFQQLIIDRGGTLDKKTAEAAVVLACEELFRSRITQDFDDDVTARSRASDTLAVIREELLREGSIDCLSYEFEIMILEELLRHGKLAYPASPREESNNIDPRANHDVYVMRPKGFAKIPISVKLGPKKTTHYAHGVRSVSRRDYERSGVPIWDYIQARIPELLQL